MPEGKSPGSGGKTGGFLRERETLITGAATRRGTVLMNWKRKTDGRADDLDSLRSRGWRCSSASFGFVVTRRRRANALWCRE
jgi:hypothetical protein